MSKKILSTLLMVPLFSFFLLVGGSYAAGEKDKTPKPIKPAPKAVYVISQAEKEQSKPAPIKSPEKKHKKQVKEKKDKKKDQKSLK